jgi:hypothetical protein
MSLRRRPRRRAVNPPTTATAVNGPARLHLYTEGSENVRYPPDG